MTNSNVNKQNNIVRHYKKKVRARKRFVKKCSKPVELDEISDCEEEEEEEF